MTTNKISIQNKKFYSKNIVFDLFSVVIIAIIIVILCNPARYNSAVLEGIHLFFVCVLPGLFPFMFLTKLLTSLGMVKKISRFFEKPTRFLFNTSGIASYVFLISSLSGYPVGAKIISDLYKSGNITQSDAKKMAAFCTTSGPLFVIGTVGTIMFGNSIIGIIMFISHIFSSILCGIILRGKTQKHHNFSDISPSAQPDNLLADTMINTIENILLVGGYITIFFLISDILSATGIFSFLAAPLNSIFHSPNIINGLLRGIIEVTQGCKLLSGNLNIASVCIVSALISFGGISIILQSMAYLSLCKIKARYFLFVKCVHSILSFLICFALCKIFIF